MCLTNPSKQKIAEEDIICFKKLVFTLSNNKKNALSEHMGFVYEKGVFEKEVEIEFNVHNQIQRAYHSYVRNESRANAIFIIPKGAIYYTGKDNYEQTPVMASNTIMYWGRNNFINRFLLKFRKK